MDFTAAYSHGIVVHADVPPIRFRRESRPESGHLTNDTPTFHQYHADRICHDLLLHVYTMTIFFDYINIKMETHRIAHAYGNALYCTMQCAQRQHMTFHIEYDNAWHCTVRMTMHRIAQCTWQRISLHSAYDNALHYTVRMTTKSITQCSWQRIALHSVHGNA